MTDPSKPDETNDATGAANALRTMEQHLASILASILASVPDAMVVIDEAGIVQAFSAAAEVLFGYRADEVVGRNVNMLMTDRDSSHHDGYLAHYMTTGERRIIGIGRVVQARRSDGREIPIDLKIGEARTESGRLFTGFMRDLTEIQRNQLRMQQMQAELANFTRLSAVGTMASAMAHELNQPLTAVANYLEAGRDLLDSDAPDAIEIVREALARAAEQSVRAGEIIRKLRDYVSRGEIETRPQSLTALIGDTMSFLQLKQTDSGARISYTVAPDADLVDVDPIQIQQVLVNLSRNALEAMRGASDATLTIEAARADADMVVVAVRDNGPGIDPDQLSNLFRPFTSSKATGMGLGLSICRTIIEAHGGQITASAPAGGGACVEFTIRSADASNTIGPENA